MLGVRKLILVSSVLVGLTACGDDTSSADGSGTGSTSTTDGGSGPTTSDTSGMTVSSGGATSGSSTGAGTTTDASGTTGSTGEETTSSTGEPTTGSSSSTGDESTGDETGGVATVCEDGGDLVLQWTLEVPGGTFPDDIPTDLDESCTFVPGGAGELPIECAMADYLITVTSTPMVELPTEGQAVDIRIRRQVGPLGFPDFWVDLEFADGSALTLVSASVLQPSNDTVELPYAMALSESECGPFNIGNPIQPEDPCGDQMWQGVQLDLDVNLTVFHGTHSTGTTGGVDVDAWVGTARNYLALPKTCDISASFYNVMVATASE